jgi:hypothetical protein
MTWGEEFERTPVAVSSPNEKVFLTLTGDSTVDVGFSYGYYDTVSDREMADQLERAVRLLVVERTRLYYAGLSRQVGERVEPGRDMLHRDARTYRERLAEISAEGEAAEGRIRLYGTGLTHFAATIEPGTIASMREEQFAAACRQAGLAFLEDHKRKIAALKFDVYLKPMLEQAGLAL